MVKNPRHKAPLIIGVILLVSAPFAAYFSPRVLSSLMCPLFIGPAPVYKPFLYDSFKCTGVDFWTAATVFIVFAVVGCVLTLRGLRLSK